VLLMDEPLSNLDAKMRLQMRDVILDLVREAGITTVFVTHDQEEALAMSDQVALMDRGAIAQVGSPEDLYATPSSAYVADFIGSANVLPVDVATEERAAQAGSTLRYRLGGQVLEGRSGGLGGGEPRLVARPEHLTLAAPAPLQPNAVPGQVLRRQFLGAKTVYRVRLAAGVEVFVEQHAGSAGAGFHAGDAVQVLLPAHCRVVPG
jgi:iron(III) transport system ATP-binding protein